MTTPTTSSAAASSSSRARGRALVFTAALFWGTSATLVRFVFRDHHVPPPVAIELRLLIAVGLLGPWLAWRRPEALRVRREDWGYLLVLGLFGVAAVQGTYYFAIATLGVGLAILMQYVAPALIIGFLALRGHRVGARVVLAVVTAVVGTGLLVGGLGTSILHVPARGWIAGVGAAVSFAFYILYSKRGLARYAPETVLFYTFLIAALFWSLITPLPRILAEGYGPNLWWMFLALGTFSTLVPFACFNAGLRHLPAAEAGVLATMEPVVAVASAALFLGERLVGIQWIGAAMVLAAAVLSSLEAPSRDAASPRGQA